MRALAVVGPTAGGKTALALALARALGGEILCCDSMQVYRNMDIGTAKPTAEERAVCPHHLFDIANPATPFSAADYAAAAMVAVRDVCARGAVPIFCGGTGLYLDAVRTMRHTGGAPPPDATLRAKLTAEADLPGGKDALWARLSSVDPAAAAATHPNNLRRVIRALEIYMTTGHTKTELDAAASTANPELTILPFFLTYENRDLLRCRINLRIDKMMADGLLEETRRLNADGLFSTNTTAAQAIGYKELLAYLMNEMTLPDALAQLRTATAQYAKRQMTYFRTMPGIRTVIADSGGVSRPLDNLVSEVLEAAVPFLSEKPSHENTMTDERSQ